MIKITNKNNFHRRIKVKALIFLGMGCWICLSSFFWPFVAFGDAPEFSPQELSALQRTTQQQVQKVEIQHWVRRIENNTPSFFHATHPTSALRRSAVLIFVSFSMPKISLQHYFRDSKNIPATLVLRGLVQNSFVNTAQQVRDIIQNHRGGFSIDPIAYEKLSIQQVPAVALLNSTALFCLQERHCIPNPSDYDIVYGNVTLHYALSIFAEKTNVLTSLAKAFLKQWRDHDND